MKAQQPLKPPALILAPNSIKMDDLKVENYDSDGLDEEWSDRYQY